MKQTLITIIAAGFAVYANAQVAIPMETPMTIQQIGNLTTYSGYNGQMVTCMRIGPNITTCN